MLLKLHNYSRIKFGYLFIIALQYNIATVTTLYATVYVAPNFRGQIFS